MNGLETLKEIRENATLTEVEFYFNDYYRELEIIEKELKAFEIIKNKKVNVTRLMVAESVEYYNKLYNDKFSLTKDEFDLLKEVLE